MKVRYLIEGEWSGYRSSQQRVVHREVTTDIALADKVSQAHGIRYSDGTMLYLSTRPVRKGERVSGLNNSYGSLIRKCAAADVWDVEALYRKEAAS